MTHLLFTFISIFLFAAFMLLTAQESRKGVRVLAGVRAKLDQRVSQAAFLFQHVDWSGFLAHLLKSSAEHLLHELAHGALIAVRTLERLLTRMVKYLRERRMHLTTVANAPKTSPFTRAVGSVKQALRRNRRTKEVEDTTQE